MNLTESRSCAARLASLLRDEQHALADFLLALADFDRRRGWVELGYSGLFPFLHRELGLSKAASFYRKTAAELLQRFPEIIEPLRDGRLCLTTVGSLAKVITSVASRLRATPGCSAACTTASPRASGWGTPADHRLRTGAD